MRTDKESIYKKLYQKAIDSGVPSNEAEIMAKKEADRIYWELVDRGRQEAKDR
jgi:hypothetical protein